MAPSRRSIVRAFERFNSPTTTARIDIPGCVGDEECPEGSVCKDGICIKEPDNDDPETSTDFSVTSFSIDTAGPVDPNSQIQVSYTVTNAGTADGYFRYTLYRNSEAITAVSGDVAAGGSQSETLSVLVEGSDTTLELGSRSDSIQVREPDTGTPEMSVTQINLDDSSYLVGETVTATVYARNSGTVTGSYSVPVRANGSQVGTADFGTISAGTTDTATVQFGAQSTGALVVDADGAEATAEVIEQRADIDVTGLILDPAGPVVGEPATATVEFTNNGAVSGTVESTVDVNGSPVGVAQAEVPANTTTTDSVTFTVPDSSVLTVETSGVSREYATSPGDGSGGGDEPNIAVQDVSMVPSPPVRTQSATIQLELVNSGSASGTFSDTVKVNDSDVGVVEATVPAGSTITAEVGIQVPDADDVFIYVAGTTSAFSTVAPDDGGGTDPVDGGDGGDGGTLSGLDTRVLAVGAAALAYLAGR